MKLQHRENIKNKFDGRCAYCGCILDKNFHVDHIRPIFRGVDEKPERSGSDTEENMFPSCGRCNRRKSTLTIEEFRSEIEKQPERLKRYSSSFRLAEDFGMIMAKQERVRFYFEKVCGKIRYDQTRE
jgi:5-methylcytosine-specific restriction endonuclease McrA